MKKVISLLSLALLTISAWSANTYVKVTSVDQLEAGKKYILVNEESSRAMGPLSGTSTPYGTYIGISITEGIIDIDGTDVVELTAAEGGTSSYGPAWYFTYADGAFMFWNSGNSLSAISSDGASLLAGVKWVPALTGDGVILKNNGDITRILQYNSSSPRFACYTSSQKPAVLYVEDASVTPPVTVAAPTLPESQEFENNFSVTITNNEEGATLVYALNDGDFTDYNGAFTINETTTVRAKAVKGDVESEVVSATYTKVEPVAYKPYVKVTSVDQLEAGKKYILVNEESNRAMGALSDTSTPYGTYVGISITDGLINIGGTGVVELTAAEGGTYSYGPTWHFTYEDGAFMFWNSGNSLSAISAEGASLLAGVKWVPALTEDGVILKNDNDITRILQYNPSSPRFACYTSSQKPAVLYVEYVSQEDEGINTLSEANALNDDEAFEFSGNAVVTVQNGDFLFLRDESGYGMIYGAVDAELATGDVLNPGWSAVKATVDDMDRFVDAEGVSASGETNAELGAAQVVTALDESLINAYVCFENAKLNNFPNRPFTLPDGTRIPVTDYLWGVNWPGSGGLFPGGSSQNYNIYGIVVKVDGELKFNPLSFEKYVEPQPQGLRGDVNMDENVSIADVSALINYLLTQDATGISLDNADTNLDEGITIGDVTALINYLLTGAWAN